MCSLWPARRTAVRLCGLLTALLHCSPEPTILQSHDTRRHKIPHKLQHVMTLGCMHGCHRRDCVHTFRCASSAGRNDRNSLAQIRMHASNNAGRSHAKLLTQRASSRTVQKANARTCGRSRVSTSRAKSTSEWPLAKRRVLLTCPCCSHAHAYAC